MKKSKAAFRAVREACGLSQQDVADEAGVQLRTVKKWESSGSDIKQPPDDVWEWLVAMRDAAYAEAARMAANAIELAVDESDSGPIYIAYYRMQADLERFGQDDRPYGLVNTISRKAAEIIEDAGYEVEFAYKA